MFARWTLTMRNSPSQYELRRVRLYLHHLSSAAISYHSQHTDEFIGILWRGWKSFREHGMVQVGLRLLSYFAWAGIDGV
jgi:hypothetical protein